MWQFSFGTRKKIIVFPINTNLLVQCFVGFQDRVDIDLAVLEVQDLSDEIIFFRQFVVFYHLKELKIHPVCLVFIYSLLIAVLKCTLFL